MHVGELVRVAAISASDHTAGHDRVPPQICGHGETREIKHQHAFYLPEDAEHEGRIDHVLIHAPGELPPAAVTALAGMRRL